MFELVNGSNKSVELENVKSLFFVDGDETKVVEQDYRADLFGGCLVKTFTNYQNLLDRVKEREAVINRLQSNLVILKAQLVAATAKDRLEELRESLSLMSPEDKALFREKLAYFSCLRLEWLAATPFYFEKTILV